jgi:hypothetical protein
MKAIFEALLFGGKESTMKFLISALKVIDTCHIFGIDINKEEQVEKIIHVLQANPAYHQERGLWRRNY